MKMTRRHALALCAAPAFAQNRPRVAMQSITEISWNAPSPQAMEALSSRNISAMCAARWNGVSPNKVTLRLPLHLRLRQLHCFSSYRF